MTWNRGNYSAAKPQQASYHEGDDVSWVVRRRYQVHEGLAGVQHVLHHNASSFEDVGQL
jgi:hypothetical protein